MKLEKLINDNYDKLNENDLHIWNYLLSHKEECKSLSIQGLAAKCNVSHTTIYRFIKKLGLESYSELKIYLKMESKQKKSFNSKEIFKVAEDYKDTIDLVLKQDVCDLYEMLENAGHIYAYGMAAIQRMASQGLKSAFVCLGYIVHTLEGKSETKLVIKRVEEKPRINMTAPFFMINELLALKLLSLQ